MSADNKRNTAATALERISVMPYKDEASGEWCVRMMVTGLQSERQACAAADYITAMFCGHEVGEH